MKKPVLLIQPDLVYQESTLQYMSEEFSLMGYDELDSENSNLVTVIFAPRPFPLGLFVRDFPNLKVIVSNTTSVDHLPIKEAEERGIKIISLTDDREFLEQITCTAEHTLGLIMAAHRRIPAAHADVCEGNWDRTKWRAPRMLSKMNLGVVGAGRVGAHVAGICSGIFELVRWYDPYYDPNWLAPLFYKGKERAHSLNGLAIDTDVLCICAGPRQGSMEVIDREVLRHLRPGAIVVNTARAGLLDEDALIDLLISGHVRAAALDTAKGEPQISPKLVAYAQASNNLILTPHIAGSTEDALATTERRVLEKALETLNG